MSRSRPTQLPLSLPPRPIPRVELAQEPPVGTRWLGVGEKLEATDLWVYKGRQALLWDKLVGLRMHKKDVGAFARKLDL